MAMALPAPAPQEAHFDAVKRFLHYWSLDSDNAVDLMRCSLHQQVQVLESFSPADPNANVNAVFSRFVWTYLRSSLSARDSNPWRPSGQTLEGFAERWGLDTMAMSRLVELPRELQAEVMAEFQPHAGSGNVSALLMAFLKSKRAARPEADGRLDAYAEFARRWGLSDEAIYRLRELPMEQQEEKMATFNPTAKTRDISAKFVSFLKARPGGGGGGGAESYWHRRQQRGGEERDDFVQRFGLDERAQDLLSELSPAMREHVVGEFAPPEGATNVSSRFMAYVKMVRSRWQEPEQVAKTEVEEEEEDSDGGGEGDFARRWGLDARAVARLKELPPEQRDEVMADFDAPSDAPDVSNLFVEFVNSRAAGAEDGNEGVEEEDAFAPYVDFAERWMLSEASIMRLRELPEELQEEAMGTFQPRAEARDVNGTFVAFLKKLQRGSAAPGKNGGKGGGAAVRGGAVEEFASSWGLDAQARERLYELPPALQDDIMASFSPASESPNVSASFMSFVKTKKDYATICHYHAAGYCKNGASCRFSHGEPPLSDGKRPRWGNDAFSEFQRAWNLDEESMALLSSLPPEVQDDVMANFAPRDTSRDVNNVFVGFAKSRRSGQGGGHNRYYEGTDWDAQPRKYQRRF